jgi:hypothetical protein
MRGGKRTYLCVSGIRIKHIGKEFTRTSHASDNQTMDIKTVNNKILRIIGGIEEKVLDLAGKRR